MNNEDFLATYGTWALESFLQCFPGETATLAIFLVEDRRSGREVQQEIGQAVRLLWQQLIARFPEAHGHRLGWNSIVFLFSEPVSESLVDRVCAAGAVHVGECEVLGGLIAVPSAVTARTALFADLEWRLRKVDYRDEYPQAICVRGGVVVHRPR